MASPTVGTSCSLAAISCITILTREGAHNDPLQNNSRVRVADVWVGPGSIQAGHFSWSKISQVTTILFMAITACTAVALILWPDSAADELRYHSFSQGLVDVQ